MGRLVVGDSMGIKRWLEILWWSMKEDWKDSSRRDKVMGLIQFVGGLIFFILIWFILPKMVNL